MVAVAAAAEVVAGLLSALLVSVLVPVLVPVPMPPPRTALALRDHLEASLAPPAPRRVAPRPARRRRRWLARLPEEPKRPVLKQRRRGWGRLTGAAPCSAAAVGLRLRTVLTVVRVVGLRRARCGRPDLTHGRISSSRARACVRTVAKEKHPQTNERQETGDPSGSHTNVETERSRKRIYIFGWGARRLSSLAALASIPVSSETNA